jgi:hypothetical protein
MEYRNAQSAMVSIQFGKRGTLPKSTVGKADSIYANFLEKLPLDELRSALSQSESPGAIRFLAALEDPSRAQTRLVALAKSSGLSLGEMTRIWREGRLTAALGIMIDAAPAIAADIVEDAKSRPTCCPRCDGAGTIHVNRQDGPSWIQCTSCRGSGSIRKPGDAGSRDLFLKAIGFVKSDAGYRVTILNQNNAPNAASVIEELEQAQAALEIFPASVDEARE